MLEGVQSRNFFMVFPQGEGFIGEIQPFKKGIYLELLQRACVCCSKMVLGGLRTVSGPYLTLKIAENSVYFYVLCTYLIWPNVVDLRNAAEKYILLQ